ncbi:beta-alanine-activating enzyme [Cephus cinctus]|uniref:Beta-alanine-activating enzyme n=1 Tax=Cephus cinctus TaxID=211228 RepID=A0AAJ7W5V3_CEPCN|nr:beta-alanine-activating enzyme [Cephus cinctus]
MLNYTVATNDNVLHRFIQLIKMSEANSKRLLETVMFNISSDCDNSDTFLHTLCDWTAPDNIAIEHHCNETEVKQIKYSVLKDAVIYITNVLKEFDASGFIGINFDVSEYIVPILMLGINTSGLGFINLFDATYSELYTKLRITYIFSSNDISESNVVRHIKVQNQTIKLCKLWNAYIEQENKVENEYAYVITTSGSTGEPKIVKVTHSCIVPNILDLKKLFQLSTGDKIIQLTSLRFDPSIVEIFLSFSCGGTLVTVTKELKNDIEWTLKMIYENRITLLQSTPSVLLYKWPSQHLQRTILSDKSDLRILLIGGELFPKISIIEDMKHAANQTRIFNIYGVTEVSCWASINEIDLRNPSKLKQDPSYLGRPLSNTMFKIKTDNGIYDHGKGVLLIGSNSRICEVNNDKIGNLERPVFRESGDLVRIDEHGDAFYEGRVGVEIKRFGNKLNTDVLRNTILKLNFVKNCIPLWDEENYKLYVCIVTCNSTNEFKKISRYKEEIINELKKLSHLYIPDKIHFIDDVELTVNGKLCTHALLKICSNVQKCNVQQTMSLVPNIKERFKNIWTHYISSIEAGFLQLGGTSVVALQMSMSLSEALKSEYPKLIGMLLRDENFEACLTYIMEESKNIRITESNVHEDKISQELNSHVNVESHVLTNDGAVLENYTNCEWQKSKGKTTGHVLVKERNVAQLDFRIELWKKYNLQKCIDASPTMFQTASGQLFVTVSSHSGKILTTELNSTDCASYEVRLPGRLLASVLVLGNFKGVIGCTNGYLYCLNLKTGNIYWQFKTANEIKGTAITCENKEYLYVGSYDHYLYSLRTKCGSQVWCTDIGHGNISSSPVINNNLVFFGTQSGACVAVYKDNGKKYWLRKMQDPIFTTPVITEKETIIFSTVAGEIFSFDMDGHLLWNIRVTGNIFSDLVIHKDPSKNFESITFASKNKVIYNIELKDSRNPLLNLIAEMKEPIVATPHCETGLIIIVEVNGTLSVINSLTGKVLTNFHMEGASFSSAVMHENFIAKQCP